MTSFQVDSAELQSLQQQLAGIAESTGSLADEADALGIGDWKMYGLFISPIACSILAIADAAHGGAINALADVTTGLDETMVSTVAAYAGVEDANAGAAQTVETSVNAGPQL